MKKEYLTVKEFSEACGISRQAVYRKLSASLQKYVKREQGKILISSKAIERLEKEKVTTPDSEVDREFTTFLKAQIEEKDRQIAKLQDQNATLQAELAEITKNAQELTRNNQILLAHEKHIERLESGESGEEAATADKAQSKQGFFKRLFKGKSEPQK